MSKQKGHSSCVSKDPSCIHFRAQDGLDAQGQQVHAARCMELPLNALLALLPFPIYLFYSFYAGCHIGWTCVEQDMKLKITLTF